MHVLRDLFPLILLAVLSGLHAQGQEVLFDKVNHGFADNEGVKIHYVTLGKKTDKPPIIMIHGFPDFWYTWRHQMEALQNEHHLVALDLRGYNKSDKPGDENAYEMSVLVEDIAAVVRAVGAEKAVVCGHDWGGAMAWRFAMKHPAMTEKLIILNLPHPKGMMRELANNKAQQKNSEYARDFQKPEAHTKLTAVGLAGWVKDPEARKRYVTAFEKSDFKSMLNYYRQNYPKPPYREFEGNMPSIKCSVLQIHGLDDEALLSSGLNDTWDWLDKDLTLVTVPGAGHFVQQDAADLVSRSIRMWLGR